MNREGGSRGNPEGNQAKTYYEVLGVSVSATAEEIKLAYRQKAKQTHPDKPENAGKETQFREVNEAYQVLSDIQKRQSYDSSFAKTSHKSWSEPTTDSNFDFEDIFKQRESRSTQKNTTSSRSDINSDFSLRKQALEEVSKQLRAELEDLFKDPVRNGLKIQNFQAYSRERMRQATEDPSSVLRGSKPKTATSTTEQTKDSREFVNRGHEQPKTSKLRIKSLGSVFTLADERGNSASSYFKSIENKGGYFIGEQSTGMYYLLSSENGKNLSSFYKEIEVINGAIIGQKAERIKVLLDPITGIELTKWYQAIEILDQNYAAGEFSNGMWYLVNRKTGRETSSFYKKIYKKGDKLIGFNGSWEDELKG